MTEAEKKNAQIIAQIMMETETEFRGDVLFLAAANLREKSNFFTANILEKAAREYGIYDPLA